MILCEMCVLSFIYIYVAVCWFCAVCCLIIMCFYLLFFNYAPYVFNILFMFVFLFCVFVFYIVYSVPFYFFLLLFLLSYIAVSFLFFMQVYRPLPPCGNPNAVNKYLTSYILIAQTCYIFLQERSVRWLHAVQHHCLLNILYSRHV